MRYCICGKVILRSPQKGHREREYCCDTCRQRAWRARNKDKHNLERIEKAAAERFWTQTHQEIHRETWQDDLERNESLIKLLLDEIKELRTTIEELQWLLASSDHDLADKEAEIVRLTTLLDSQSKKKPRR